MDIKSCCDVLGELKADLVELAGQDRADDIYRLALAQFGAEHSNSFRNLGHARQCASLLWQEIQGIKKQSDDKGAAA